MKAFKYILILIVLILIIWGVVALQSNKNTIDNGLNEPIRIGAALSLSGPASSDGEAIQSGLELAKKDLSERGIEVEIVYQDDETDPKKTVSAINALNVQGVEAIIGPTWSFLADAGIPVLDRLGIVAIMPANTTEYVGAKSPYAFFTATRVDRLVPTLTDWLQENNVQDVAIIGNQGLWYQTVGNVVRSSIEGAGGQVNFFEQVPFDADASAISTVVAKLKTVNPDIVFAEMDDERQIVTLFNRLQEQGISADVMSVTTAIGRVVNGNNVHISDDDNVYVLAPKATDAFEEKYKEEYGVLAPPYADRSYDSLMLLVEAIVNRGEMELSDYLSDVTNYEGFVSTYDFDENGDIAGGEWEIRKIETN